LFIYLECIPSNFTKFKEDLLSEVCDQFRPRYLNISTFIMPIVIFLALPLLCFNNDVILFVHNLLILTCAVFNLMSLINILTVLPALSAVFLTNVKKSEIGPGVTLSTFNFIFLITSLIITLTHSYKKLVIKISFE